MRNRDRGSIEEHPNLDRGELVSSFLELAKHSPITVRDLVRIGESMLTHAQVACTTSLGSRHREATYLTFFVLGIRDFDSEHLDARVTLPEIHRVLGIFDERITRRVPAAYLTNEALFKGYRFYVNENVLVPRSVLSNFIEQVIEETSWESDRVLDIGTGSGALGIVIAIKRPELRVDLADISPEAIEVARRNVQRFFLGQRVKTIVSDLFSNVEGPYSLIVFNPPYVTEAQYETESVEEVRNEPRLAIVGGEEGLDLILPTIREAPRHLTPEGTLVIEVGPIAEAILKKRYPHMPFRWLSRPGQPWAGVLTLRNGYPPLDPEQG